MDITTYKEKLASAGFKHIFDWRDAPRTIYPEHAHRDKVAFYIVKGSINMNINGEPCTFKVGDYCDMQPGVKHSAKVGDEGCTFVVGEMIDGDS